MKKKTRDGKVYEKLNWAYQNGHVPSPERMNLLEKEKTAGQ